MNRDSQGAEGPALRLDPAAARWLAARGGAVTLRSSPRHGCCGGTAHLPVAEPGAPAEAGNWEARRVDGVTVYLDPALTGHGEALVVRAEGFWGWRRLFVEHAEAGGG